MPSHVLTINGGSSSIRFAVFDLERPLRRSLSGKLERIGGKDASFSVQQRGMPPTRVQVDLGDHDSAIESFMDWIEAQPFFSSLGAIGHRIVHGMEHTQPERVTPQLLTHLKAITPYDSEHLPREIGLIEALQSRFGELPQVACFDTAFHRSMPLVATTLPIPRRYAAKGVRRYGFHGLSYTFLMEELGRIGDTAASTGRVILAHLGSGASLAAVRNGACIDTSMGFTPTAGLVMATRTGDLDPGLMSYLALSESMSAADFQTMVNHESGLLGVSASSSDIRDLLAREAEDSRAAEAIALFCYQAKKWIGAFAAALGGVDTVVFAGGIGENASVIRARICAGLEFLGVHIDAGRNERGAALISSDAASAKVRVIHTDEEVVIADLSVRLLGLQAG